MAKNNTSSILIFDFIINTCLTVVELIAGSISGSIALLADGFQNLTDSIVITIAYTAEWFTSKRGLSKSKRASVYRITGTMNAVILVSLAIYIGYNAVYRLLHPQPVNTKLVIWVGLLSVVVNWLAAGLLYSRRRNKTVRAPYAGLFFSGISGMGVFVSGLLAQYLNVENIDGIVGLLIAFLLLMRSVDLFNKSVQGR